MSNKLGKRDVHFHPNWGYVVLSVAVIVGAVYLFYWGIWLMPLSGALHVILAIVTTLIAIFLCFSAGMQLIFELYCKGVWATPEEQKMHLPGEDLVKDPYGRKVIRLRQARDLDAPLEEVWKHVYQLDPTKGGMYAWSNCERLFGMNVDNAYVLEDMWQGEDACRPGDFWAWSYGGFGAEVADVVENKYIVWYCDTRDPIKTPGASYMQTPGKKYVNWYWTIALFPLDGGKRCRIINGWDTAYGPHSFFNWYSEHFIIGCGGTMMGRRMFRNLELAALHKRRKSIPLRIQAAIMGRCWQYDERLHDIVAYPDLRWGRDCPRVEKHRAPFTEDPNWPPKPGEDYVPPIEENNAKHGWTPARAEEIDRIAEEKERAFLDELGLEGYQPRSS
ncbi:MAG: hypothetical protein ACOYIK_10805 [Coriobacteriales bacterium]|jgi:hypothetical protein